MREISSECGRVVVGTQAELFTEALRLTLASQQAARVASLTKRRVPNILLAPSRRDARFTASPMTV